MIPSRIVLVGLNHRTAPVDVREKVAYSGEKLKQGLRELSSVESVEGGMILSTCNRTEIFACAKDEAPEFHLALERFFARAHGLPEGSLKEHLYFHFGLEAVRHLFRVAASLDSMVLGEPQILGQTKEACEAAREAGLASGLAGKVFEKTLRSAKCVRTSTAVGDGAVSVGYAAVELARKIFSDLAKQRILVIGAGEMAETVVENLKGRGAQSLVVSNRNYENAVALAARFGGSASRFDDLESAVPQADIIISATACPIHILGRDRVERMLDQRLNKPLFIIDIAMPRDIDPAVGEIEGVFLYNLDDLQRVVGDNRSWREAEAKKAERILDAEVAQFAKYLETLDVDPVLRAVQEKAERIRTEELERTESRLAGLTPDQRDALDKMTRAMVKKVLDDPMNALKGASRNGEGHDLASAVKRLFRL